MQNNFINGQPVMHDDAFGVQTGNEFITIQDGYRLSFFKLNDNITPVMSLEAKTYDVKGQATLLLIANGALYKAGFNPDTSIDVQNPTSLVTSFGGEKFKTQLMRKSPEIAG